MVDNVSGSNGNGRLKDRAVEDEGVEFAVFAARVGIGREIAEKEFVQFAAGKAGIENFRIDASGDSAEMMIVKITNQFAGVALPDGKKGGHADASKIFLAIGAEVFEKDIAESDLSNALVVEEAKCLFHASFIDGIDALRRNEDFMQRQVDRDCLTVEEFATDTVHGYAVIALGDGGKKGGDVELLLLEQRVQRHGAVFAAAPAEKNGFEGGQENLQELLILPR